MTEIESGGLTESSARARRLLDRWRSHGLAYVAAFLAGSMLALLWLQPWAADWSGQFADGGDLLFGTATGLVHGQAGLIGATPHLAWPQGFSPWGHPQMGMLFAALSWFLIGALHVGASLSLYMNWVIAVGLGAAASLFFFRSVAGRKNVAVSVALAVALSAGAFAQTRVLQLHAAAFFVIPVLFAVVARFPHASKAGRLGLVAVGALAALGSGMWWATVGLLILGVVLIVQLIRRDWDLVVAALVAVSTCAVGLGVQLLLLRHYAIDIADTSRGPWDSDLYGGHLTDLFLGSPTVNAALPYLQRMLPGASIGNSMVGLIPSMAALVAVAVILVGAPRHLSGRIDTRVLADITVVSLLFFLLGGLGNVQAALAVLVGTESPARNWARLIVILALVGLAWVLVWIKVSQEKFGGRWQPRGVLASALLIVLVGSAWFADSRQIVPVYPVAQSKLPEYGGVSFIQRSRQPCPIAQLPQDSFPMLRVSTAESNAAGMGYRGFRPYLMAPDFFWSYGSWIPDVPAGLNLVDRRLSEASLQALAKQGYCAILFDKLLSRLAADAGVPLEGGDASGLAAPDFDSEQFSVYLLGESKAPDE